MWDYKTKKNFRWGYETDTEGNHLEDWQRNTMKCIWVKSLGGMVNGADIGNINYGFVAPEVMSKELAQKGAGWLQILQGRSNVMWASSYFDDPEDMSFIKNGILLREELL